jgi:host factor-I protein
MRPKKEIRIQDGFLFESLKENRPVALVLNSGQAIGGQIRRFDRYAVLIDDGKQEILVYKHAIAGIGVAGR